MTIKAVRYQQKKAIKHCKIIIKTMSGKAIKKFKQKTKHNKKGLVVGFSGKKG